ncbi:MAG: prephenate dehydratase [bacterium]
MTSGPTVAYLGPRGTYSEEAVDQIMERLGVADYEPLPRSSIFDSLAAVAQGEADRAVVPFENSLEGSVTATLDALAVGTEGLEIIGTHEMAITHCLVALAELPLQEISVVLSHPQATGQCSAFLRRELAQAEVRAAASTAEAVRLVAEHGAPWAAIGSRSAARIYECSVLEDEIEDESVNVTRFGLISRAGEVDRVESDRWGTSLVFSEMGEDHPGALAGALTVFSSRGINLTRIQSQPIRGDLGRYMFFLDLEGSTETEAIAEAVTELEGMAESVKVLGSYPII